MLTMKSPDIDVILAGYAPVCTGRQRKTYVYYAVHCMLEGTVELRFDRGGPRRILQGAWCWCAWPGRFLDFSSPAPRRHCRLAATGGLPSDWFDEGLLPRDPRLVPDPEMALERWRIFTGSIHDPRARERRLAVNAFEAFLLSLAPADEDPAPGWLADLRRRLDVDIAADPDWDAEARRAGIGLSTFRRIFTRFVGLPPHRYLVRRRCVAARRLLADSVEPLRVIAEHLGYRDVYFFARQFKQVVGIPPGEYRKRVAW
jgi:AraC-like DNA-binding protein